MTTDSLLAMLLSVALPTFMALGGALIAIRSLPAKKAERNAWLAFFLVLTFIAIALAFVQQVRATTAEKARAANESRDRQDAISTNRYTQGQLDSINRVLSAIATNPNIPQPSAALLNGLLVASKQASQPPSMQKDSVSYLSDEQLALRALEAAAKIRSIAGKYQSELNDLDFFPQNLPDEVKRDRASKAKSAAIAGWAALRPECDVLLSVMRMRLTGKKLPLPPDSSFSEQEMDSGTSGPNPFDDFARILQTAAASLQGSRP